MQNLGSIDILCSDKTGTLTSGAMQVDRYLDPLGKPSAKVALYAYLNSFHETGVKSALDTAILAHDQPDVGRYQKIDEIPFDFDRRRLSIVVSDVPSRLLITKGAPEGVLMCCSQWETDAGVAPLDAAARATCQHAFEELSSQGLRVLAIAYRTLTSQDAFSLADERDLTLAGFATFLDPPLPDAAEAVQALSDGVRIKILTGDNELVARHVCQQVKLDGERLVLGSELETMTDAALGHVAEAPPFSRAYRPRRRIASSWGSSSAAMSSAFWAMASTMPPRCTWPTSACRSARPSMSPRTPPTSF